MNKKPSDNKKESKLKNFFKYISGEKGRWLNNAEFVSILTKNKLAILASQRLCETIKKDRELQEKLFEISKEIIKLEKNNLSTVELQKEFDCILKKLSSERGRV